MGSSRLPGKVLKKINSKTLLSILLEQLKNCKSLETIVVATTELKEDDQIIDSLKHLNIPIFRGNSENVLDRFYQCAKKFQFSTIVRLTADNPLIDPFLIDSILDIFSSSNCDYLSNTQPHTFPQGNDVEIFSFEALEKSWFNAKKFSEKEHVTPFIYNNPHLFKIENFSNNEDYSNFRWTVDYLDDFKFVQQITQKIISRPFLIREVLSLLEREPELKLINKNHDVSEGYRKTLYHDKDYST